MKKDIFIVTKHTYWEHYGSKPSKYEYETREEALAVANKYESDFFMEDGYYATVHKESRIVITPEEEALRLRRQAAKKPSFNYRKDAYAYGIYTFWDGTKEIYFITLGLPKELDEFGYHKYGYYIFFLKSKEYYKLADKVDYFGFNLKNKWCLSDGEDMYILGGQILSFSLPKSCQHIDTVQLITTIPEIE